MDGVFELVNANEVGLRIIAFFPGFFFGIR